MTPAVLTWPGSDDVVTITRSDNSTYDSRDAVAEFLSSRYPQWWPMVDGASVDQRLAWRSLLADVYYVSGVVLVARHTSSANGIIAAAIAKPTRFPREAELIVQSSGGYAAPDVDPRMLAEMQAECMRVGLVLGHAEMVRKWVAL